MAEHAAGLSARCVTIVALRYAPAEGKHYGNTLYMVELSEGLKTMQPNEKQAMQQMLERESKREKNLEARAKELRQKEKRASEMKAADGAADLTSWEEQLKTIEADFWRSVQTKEERAPASDFPIDDEACEDEES